MTRERDLKIVRGEVEVSRKELHAARKRLRQNRFVGRKKTRGGKR